MRTDGLSSSTPIKDSIKNASDVPTGYVMAGMLRARAGSGKIATNNEVVEAGSRNQDFTLTYTADTPLTDDVATDTLPASVNLMIRAPDAIVTALTTDSKKDGYVVNDEDDDEKLTISPAGKTITWTGLILDEKGDTFQTIIRDVDISDLAGDHVWEASINGNPRWE